MMILLYQEIIKEIENNTGKTESHMAAKKKNLEIGCNNLGGSHKRMDQASDNSTAV